MTHEDNLIKRPVYRSNLRIFHFGGTHQPLPNCQHNGMHCFGPWPYLGNGPQRTGRHARFSHGGSPYIAWCARVSLLALSLSEGKSVSRYTHLNRQTMVSYFDSIVEWISESWRPMNLSLVAHFMLYDQGFRSRNELRLKRERLWLPYRLNMNWVNFRTRRLLLAHASSLHMTHRW